MKKLLIFTLCLALGIIGYSALSVRQKPRLQMECMKVRLDNPDGSTSDYDCADPRVMETFR